MHSLPSTSSSRYVNPPNSETSFFEQDTTFALAESYNATNHIDLGVYATKYHIEGISHNPSLSPNNDGQSKSCGLTIDVTREAIPFTDQALKQSADGDKTTQYLLSQNHAYSNNLEGIAGYTPTLAAYNHASVDRYLYPCERTRLHTPATSLQEHGHNNQIEAGPLKQPIEHQDPHPYPVFIHLEGFDHQVVLSELYIELLFVKQELHPAPTSRSDTLAGVGTQFSG